MHDRNLNIVLNPRDFVRTPRFFGPDRRRLVFANYSGEERRKASGDEPSAADMAVDEDIFDRISAKDTGGSSVDDIFDSISVDEMEGQAA